MNINQPAAAQHERGRRHQTLGEGNSDDQESCAFICRLAGLAIAGARTYTVSLLRRRRSAGTELKPGEYKVEVNDQKATIRQGKVQSESPVKVEENDVKFDTTTVRYSNSGGKSRIQEIRLGRHEDETGI